MAIQYGPYSGRARFGIDVSMSPSTVTKDTTSVTLTWKVYLQTDRGATPGYSGTYTLSRTGTGPTGSGSVSVYTQGTTPQLLGTWTQAVSTSYSSTASRSLSVTFTSALFDGSNPSHTRAFTVPKRPPQVPSPPTAASAAYVSDSRINVTWTRPSNAGDAGSVWTNAIVQRQIGSGAWSTVATLAGTATSFADNSTTANMRYRYRVAGRNASGSSTYVLTDNVHTTPALPHSVTAAKNEAGDIVISWVDMSSYNESWEVQDETTTIGTPPNGSPSAFTHVGPNPAVTHRYRVRAVAEGPRYSLWSAYSNVVQLLTAPAPPANLSPNGTPQPAEDDLTLSWAHVPVDTTPQTAYELRHRPADGSWTTVSGTTAQSRDVTVGTYASGSIVEWQVRTKGSHPDWSDWSAVASFVVSATPTATISAPAATVTQPSTTVAWSYYHAGGETQGGWQAEALDSSDRLLQSGSGTTGTSWETGSVLPNGSSVTFRVRVRSSSGLWSEWDSVTRDVNFDPPAVPVVSAQWVNGAGYALVSASAVSEVGLPETVDLSVERSTDGGVTWVTLADELGTDANIQDFEAPATGSYHYRVTAFSDLPSSASVDVEVVVPDVRDNRMIWISGGPAFSIVCGIKYSPAVSSESGRNRTLHSFAGRSLPVEFSGTSVTASLDVSGALLPDAYAGRTLGGVTPGSTRAEFDDLFALPGPHLYRDPEGRIMYGTVSAVRWGRSADGSGTVSFTITRSDRGSDSQLMSLSGYHPSRLVEVSPGVYQVVNVDVAELSPGTFEEVV